MRNQFQALDWAVPKIEKRFRKNPNSSLSAIFRDLRKSLSLSLFGDYPIVSVIVGTLKRLGIKVARSKLRYALRQSEELKGKRDLVSQLLN